MGAIYVAHNNAQCIGFLSNREAVRGFVKLIDPLVRPLDALVGERVGIKVGTRLCCNGGYTSVMVLASASKTAQWVPHS